MTRRTETPPEDYVPSELAGRIVQAVVVSLEPILLRLFPDRVNALLDRAAWAVDKILERVGVAEDGSPEADPAQGPG